MKYSSGILLIIFCAFFCSCARTGTAGGNGAYSISPSIRDEVEKKISSAGGITFGAIDYKLYENDSLVLDAHDKKKGNECLVMALLTGDTISITGFMGMLDGFGYTIGLHGDTCTISHFAKSDARIYKLHKNDPLQAAISVPCTAYSLTLAAKPSFMKGETVEGIIELTSGDYYETIKGTEVKYKMQLKGWFKTPPLEDVSQDLLKDHEEEINRK